MDKKSYYIYSLKDAEALQENEEHLFIAIDTKEQPENVTKIWQIIRQRVGAQLKSLQVSATNDHLGINYIPDFVSEFSQLTYIYICSGERFPSAAALLPATLSLLTKLETFELTIYRNSGDVQIPNLSASAKTLHKLYIHLPDGGNLPEWLRYCGQLHKLECYKSNASALPDLFQKLPKLEDITITDTQITEIPPSLFQLKKLKSLCLSNGKISSLPAALWQLPALESFVANSNKISQVGVGLTADIIHRSPLKKLVIGNNPIQWLSPHLWDMRDDGWLHIGAAAACPPTDWWLEEENLYGCFRPQNRIAHFSRVDAASNNGGFVLRFLRKRKKEWASISCTLPANAPQWSQAIRAVWLGTGEQRWAKAERNELLRFVWAAEKGETAPLAVPSLLRAYSFQSDEHLQPLLDKALHQAYAAQWATHALHTQSRLALLGDFFAPTPELQTQFKPYFKSVQAKITPQCSHALLSMNASSKDIETLIANPNIVPMLWSEGRDFLRKQGHFHLLQTQAPDTIQLENLLLSADTDNINLGLRLLSSAGLPPQLYEALGAIIARGKSYPAQFGDCAQEARKFLISFTSADFAHQIYPLICSAYSKDSLKNTKKACENGLLDRDRLLRALNAIKSNYRQLLSPKFQL